MNLHQLGRYFHSVSNPRQPLNWWISPTYPRTLLTRFSIRLLLNPYHDA